MKKGKIMTTMATFTAGAVTGMMLAPKKGEELREDVKCTMKKAVKNYVVLLWASVYLLAWILVAAVREIRGNIRQVTGEVSLIRSILFLCFGVCAIGYAGVVIALLSH